MKDLLRPSGGCEPRGLGTYESVTLHSEQQQEGEDANWEEGAGGKGWMVALGTDVGLDSSASVPGTPGDCFTFRKGRPGALN